MMAMALQVYAAFQTIDLDKKGVVTEAESCMVFRTLGVGADR